jgi:type I restriction enzyme S subunit
VGVIPEDWLNPQLQEITGDDFPICYGIVQVGPFSPNGIRVLAIKNLNLDYGSNIHRASAAVERPYSRSRIRPYDVVVSVKGTTGRVGIVPAHFQGNISRDLARIRPRAEIAPRFIYQMLQSELVQGRLTKAAVGTTRMELSIAILKQVHIPLPPTKAEQEAIAEALSDADAVIESLQQLVRKKRHLKQGAMEELLTGKRRLPGFSAEWELRALGEIATANKGSQLSSSLMTEHGRFAHLNGGISPSGYTNKSNALGDTIAISEGGNSCGYVQFMLEPYWCGGHCYSVIPNGIDNRFLYHALKGVESSIMGLRVGSGLPNVQKTALLAFNLRCPKASEEQTALATILSDMDAEIAALEGKLAKARQLKQGLMQELLTGTIRLV